MVRLLLIAVLVVGCGKSPAQSGSGSGTGSGPTAPAAAPTKPPVDPRIAAFWTWFSQHAAELHADKDLEHTMLQIGEELAKVDPSLIAEVGALDGKRELVITADGHKELFPRVKEVYAARPTSVDGWTIVAFRQRDPKVDGFSIEMGKQSISAKSVKFVATPSSDKLDIEVFVPGFTTMDEMGAVAYLLLDHTVGEYDMETKIGGIDISGIDKAPTGARPLTELPAAVDALR